MVTEFRDASRARLKAGEHTYEIFRLDHLRRAGFRVERLPFSLKVLLENLLRHEDGESVCAEDIRRIASWDGGRGAEKEIAFRPARVLLQDFTGVPAVVDLAALRDAMESLGGDPMKINPLQPAALVIDHSVQVDSFASPGAFRDNVRREYERNGERYRFLRWGQQAFRNFRVVPPGSGIVHQVNVEYLASVVFRGHAAGNLQAYPDTLVGTDSHTTMVNGLGVLGWGVGGIEAEAAMLGQPIAMLIPNVVGLELRGSLPEGATATDLVLTVTEILRKKGVVGKFVEFYGEGLRSLGLAARATVSNMAPEYGATCAFFPVDAVTIEYLRFTGRDEELVRLVESYCREQGLFHEPGTPAPVFSDTVSLDLASVVPSLAGPRRPQDRVALGDVKASFRRSLVQMVHRESAAAEEERLSAWIHEGGDGERNPGAVSPEALGPLAAKVPVVTEKGQYSLQHGSVVIAAITSCTNTSNPEVMIAAGLLAKKAVARGLRTAPWVKTSLAPGSQVVTDYLARAGLDKDLEALGFHLVGYGCTTCIGNSGPLPGPVAAAVEKGNLVAAAVLSGNRNFEGRINPHVRANYLASPPLVVAYAIAGRMDVDLTREALGRDPGGKAVFLRDIWPTSEETSATVRQAIQSDMFRTRYGRIFEGDQAWRELEVPQGDRFRWDPASTYVKRPPFFENLSRTPQPPSDVRGARVLALLGDTVTTDHISPAGSIPAASPAGKYLVGRGVKPQDFNQYGSRRGNDEVMVRGTFANIRLRNLLAPGTEGGVTLHLPDGAQMAIYDAAVRYREERVPLLVIAGAEYGTGSSRDWAAKGTALLGVRAVIAASFERIHRSNLVGMGVLPLQFMAGEDARSLGLSGRERFDLEGISAGLVPFQRLEVKATDDAGRVKTFAVTARLDTPVEVNYYRHGGILPYVLRHLMEG